MKVVSESFTTLTKGHLQFSEDVERDLAVLKQELSMEREKTAELQLRGSGIATGSQLLLMGSGSIRRQLSTASRRSSHSTSGAKRSKHKGGDDASSDSVAIVLSIPDAQSEDSRTDNVIGDGGDGAGGSPGHESGKSNPNDEVAGQNQPDDGDSLERIEKVESDSYGRSSTASVEEGEEDEALLEEGEVAVRAEYLTELEGRVGSLTAELEAKDELIEHFAEERAKHEHLAARLRATEADAIQQQQRLLKDVELAHAGKIRSLETELTRLKQTKEAEVGSLKQTQLALQRELGILQHKLRLRSLEDEQRLNLENRPLGQGPQHHRSITAATNSATSSSQGGGDQSGSSWFLESATQTDPMERDVVYTNLSTVVEGSVGSDSGLVAVEAVSGWQQQCRALERELDDARERLREAIKDKSTAEYRHDRLATSFASLNEELHRAQAQLKRADTDAAVKSTAELLHLKAQVSEQNSMLSKLRMERDLAEMKAKAKESELKRLVLLQGGSKKSSSSPSKQGEGSNQNNGAEGGENLSSSSQQSASAATKFEELSAIQRKVDDLEAHRRVMETERAELLQQLKEAREKLRRTEAERESTESTLRGEVLQLSAQLRDEKEIQVASSYKKNRNVVSAIALEEAHKERDTLRQTLSDIGFVMKNTFTLLGLPPRTYLGAAGEAAEQRTADATPSRRLEMTDGDLANKESSSGTPKAIGTTATKTSQSSANRTGSTMSSSGAPVDPAVYLRLAKELHLTVEEELQQGRIGDRKTISAEK
jgi:hypothetical protein